MLKSKGLSVARRSRGEDISPETSVYLGDTIGEMGLYLRLTEVAFVGRSMTAEGGQNPIEPAALARRCWPVRTSRISAKPTAA